MEVSQGNVTLQNCEEFHLGCPKTNFWKDEFYKCMKYICPFHFSFYKLLNEFSHFFFYILDPACQLIDKKRRCYTLDPLCPLEDCEEKKNVIENTTNDVLVAFLVLALLSIIAIWLYYRYKRKRKGM